MTIVKVYGEPKTPSTLCTPPASSFASPYGLGIREHSSRYHSKEFSILQSKIPQKYTKQGRIALFFCFCKKIRKKEPPPKNPAYFLWTGKPICQQADGFSGTKKQKKETKKMETTERNGMLDIVMDLAQIVLSAFLLGYLVGVKHGRKGA